MQPSDCNILSWCKRREIEPGIKNKLQRKFQVNDAFVRRLGLEQELEGHSGCVNCLQWSEDGKLLVSGSDDFNIIIWDMLRRKAEVILPSGHQGNIFAVKFLPYSNNTTIASAAADASVRIGSLTTLECTQYYDCHTRRIKRLEVSNHSPYNLWSGSEDGTVREFDIRQPHWCESSKPCNNVLINLTGHIGPASEVKCIQIHPLHPQYIAVGCSDPFVRLYDRRMLKLTDVSNSKPRNASELQPPNGCVTYYTPGHIPSRTGRFKSRKHKHYVTTYTCFSPDGQELLQNLGGEHIYIYKLNQERKPLIFTSDSHRRSEFCQKCHKPQNKFNQPANKNGLYKNGYSNGLISTYEQRLKGSCNKLEIQTKAIVLTDDAMQLKLQGNDYFSQQNYFQAVACYNDALKLVPDSSVLYANRAAALLKRAWDGDIYGALRDSHIAVELDPTHSKAYYRQARCLYELRWYDEAYMCIQRFKENFPEQANGYSIKKLEMEISQHIAIATHKNPTDESEDKNGGETPRHRRRLPHTASNDYERLRRENALDYTSRFVGACNTTTDIKEANYFGNDGQYIIAGSDCGCMLLWERETTNLIEAWQGDESIVNCLQPHPTSCLIATSGIDPVVRLWSPRSVEHNINDTRAKEVEGLVRSNQKRMNTDPLEEMLRTMGYRTNIDSNSDEDDDNDGSSPNESLQCRTA